MMIQCPICHDKRKIIKLEGRLNLYRCNSCLHTFTLIPKEKQESYSDDYFLKTHRNWFNNPNYQLFDFIYEQILKLLPNKKIQLLDVGCGKGDFLRYIAKKNTKIKLFGIDLIDNRSPNIHFIKGDFLKEKIQTKFNVICSLAVIDHINDPSLFVQKLNNLLQREGILFIMAIDNNSLIYRIARLLSKLGMPVAHDRLYSSHHLQHYTKQSLKKLMTMNGFDVLLQKNHNYPLKAVDVPKSNFAVEKMYKFLVRLIFLLSPIFKSEMLQTIICKKGTSK